MLARKLWRELRRQSGLLAAVVAVVALGVMLFVGSAAGYLDLSTSYQRLEDRLRLADLHVDADVDDVAAARVAALPEVLAVERRTVVSLPITLPGGSKLEGRAITLPDRGPPTLDQLHLLSGTLPAPGQVVVEAHLAETFHLAPGDLVTVDLGGGNTHAWPISGVAVSAEYLWVSRSEQDPMPTPTEFGVLWLRRADARDAARAALAGIGVAGMQVPPGLEDALAAVRVAAGDGDSQLLVDLAPGADLAPAEAAVRSSLGGTVGAVTPRAKLVGVRLLQMDVDGLRGMAVFFPLFFLGVSAFVFAAVMARVVDGQRSIIGTLVALGVPRPRILRHYLAFALVVGGVGAAFGTIGGVLAGWGLTAEYAAELHIPEVTTEARPLLWLVGGGLGLVVAALAALGPARRAAGLAPAEAMRPPAPITGRAMEGLRRLGGLPLPLRLAIRGIARRPLRSVSTAMGVAVALVLVLTTSGLVESIGLAVRVQAEDAWRYDLRADLLAPMPAAELRRAAHDVAGVREVEVALDLPARITGSTAKDTVVQGLVPGGTLLRSVDFAGHEQLPSPGGVVLPRALARDLGLQVGDIARVRILPDGPEGQVRVDGLAEAAIGGTAVMRLADLATLAKAGDAVNAVVATVDPAALTSASDGLRAVPAVVRVQDIASLRALIDQFTGLVWAFVGAMLGASVVLAAAVLYDTASLAILERTRELATLRTLGQSMRSITFAVTLEHGALALVGLGFGLPIAAVCIHYVVGLYSNDLFAMPFVLSLRTVAVAGLGVGLVLLVAQWPALRQVARMDLAAAVRTREG